MKKKIITFAILLVIASLFTVALPQITLAGWCASGAMTDDSGGPCTEGPGATNNTSGGTSNNSEGVQLANPLGAGVNIDTLIKNFIVSVLGLSGVLALVAFVFGGIYWVLSMGDTNKITKGKNIMIWAIMGLVVIFGSYAIITLVYNVLGIK